MSVEAPGTRDSWYGSVPPGWTSTPLLAIAEERDEPNSGLKERNLLSLSHGSIVRKDIDSNQGLLPESFETYQVVHPGDLVLRLTDMQNDQRSLRSGLVGELGIITSAYLALRLRGVDLRFAAYQFRAIDQMKILYAMGGGVRQSMKYTELKRLSVVVPPLDEQRRIADFLDRETAQIDEFIVENEKLIALLGERRAAVIARAVTKGLDDSVPIKDSDTEWIGGVPAIWDVLPLRYLLAGVDQGASPQAEAGLADGEGQAGVLKSGCVNGGVFRADEHKLLPSDYEVDDSMLVKTGDLLVNRASGSIDLLGSAGLVTENPYRLMLSDKTFRFHPSSRTSARYLYWMLNSRGYRAQVATMVSGAEGMANNLPMSTLRSFVFALPPLDEQRRIVEYLEEQTARIDEAIATAREGIMLAKERRAALISAAVTGKLDLSEVA